MRPQLITDPHAKWLQDPTDLSYVGYDAPFGRDRCVNALSTNGTGPVLVRRDGVVVDAGGVGVADPDGHLVGHDGIWVHRLVQADKVEDTRRL